MNVFFLQVIIIHSLFVQMSNEVYTVEAGILSVFLQKTFTSEGPRGDFKFREIT